ncbi:hypothetical protein AK812_SmicGene1300 [Symbiodinium microadriaticum]|uniref:Uncharacterized protein n=1 Tax=Symbiodinium microadriaticum TaxID=2951 RepID=A0A1Q9F4H3_SYMMI|nr:hypothetical protein AK812_SmicGene1300 [Symbiodinium microadriaticum]
MEAKLQRVLVFLPGSLERTSSANTAPVRLLTKTEPPLQEGPARKSGRPLWAEQIYALPEFVQRRADTALLSRRRRNWEGLAMADYELYEMDSPKRKRPPPVDILSFTVSRKEISGSKPFGLSLVLAHSELLEEQQEQELQPAQEPQLELEREKGPEQEQDPSG